MQSISASIEQLQEEIAQLRATNQQLTTELAKTSRIKDVLDGQAVIVITDANGVMTYVNDGFCELSKYSREELLGQKASIVNSGYHPESFFADLWQTVMAGNVWEGEIRNKAKDGTYFWADMMITPLADEPGLPQQFVGVRKDTTKDRQLTEQRRFDAYILSHVHDAVIGLDADYQVNYWNQGAVAQYGLEAGEIMGKPLTKAYQSVWISVEDKQRSMQELAEKGYCRTKIIHRLRSGKEIYVDAATQVLTNEAGESIGLLAVIRDITERHQAEEVLNKTLKELEKRNYELDNYVYKVSHDLRAPLTSMQGLLNLIKQEENPATRQQYLSLIEGRTIKLDDYIQSILHHSKMLNAAVTITPINFRQLIDTCFEELKYYKNWERIGLEVQISDGVAFYNDEFRLTVVLKNIISNAIKYLNPQAAQSYLRFDINITPDKTQLTAQDNGIGIDGQHLKRIFDMFFRAATVSEGSGLGLYIVKQAIEKMQGTIRVESERGVGTSFIIELPNLSPVA